MRRDYLSRLSRAARWYLPPAEAAEAPSQPEEEQKEEISDGGGNH